MVATLSNVAFEAPHEDGAISTFQTTSTQYEYLSGEREYWPPVKIGSTRRSSGHATPSAAEPSPGTLAHSFPAPQSPLPSQKPSTAAAPPPASRYKERLYQLLIPGECHLAFCTIDSDDHPMARLRPPPTKAENDTTRQSSRRPYTAGKLSGKSSESCHSTRRLLL